MEYDFEIDWSNCGEDKFKLMKSIIENPEYQQQIQYRYPKLVDEPIIRIGAYVGKLEANTNLTDKYINEVPGYENAFVLQFQRILDPSTQKFDYVDFVNLPLTQRDFAGGRDYPAFQKAFAERMSRDVAPYLQKPKLLSEKYFQQMTADIDKKRAQLEQDYPDYKVVVPLAQELFDTWESPNHPLLVLPPGFQDDTMHQLREQLAGDKDKAFFEEFPRAVHMNFKETGRMVYLFEQQFPAERDYSSIHCFVEPGVPSVQYLTSTNFRLDDLMKGTSSIVLDDVERVTRFRKLRNGKVSWDVLPTQAGMDAGEVFLSTLYQELQLPCTSDDMPQIEEAVVHATENAFLHNGIQADIEDWINKYAPIPAGTVRELYAPQIIEKALKNPEVEKVVQPHTNEREK